MKFVTRRPKGQPTRARKATKARLEAIANQGSIPRVRVVPASDALRRVLKHANGVKFRSQGSIEWPLDKYTLRRLAEGSVTIEEKKEENKEAEPEPESEPVPAPVVAPAPAARAGRAPQHRAE
jgi:hypothetical protein